MKVLFPFVPVVFLLITIISVMIVRGADFVSDFSPFALLSSAVVAALITVLSRRFNMADFRAGMLRSMRQTLPAVPLLLLIACISAGWMLSGVVPALICYGLDVLNPGLFLMLCCLIRAAISILTGSSWTTIATVGIAFMGIGTALGFSSGWIAGAIISGAYFGDKMSPLSDTTVIAASACDVDLFSHIRNMMFTSGPAMLIALLVFAAVGLFGSDGGNVDGSAITSALHNTFNLSPWLMVIPAATAVLIILRLPTVITLGGSTILGVVGMFVFQPQIVSALSSGSGLLAGVQTVADVLWSQTAIPTGDASLDQLVATSGITGMLPTIWLVLAAMTFGGVMMGCGHLEAIGRLVARRLHNRTSCVTMTAASGIMLNAATADQYLSIIVGSNLYKPVYSKRGLEPRLLSRTVEDSTSVTSVLIPWNSCGVTQSTVLGVATLAYLPYCIFNILSPVITVLAAIRSQRRAPAPSPLALCKTA